MQLLQTGMLLGLAAMLVSCTDKGTVAPKQNTGPATPTLETISAKDIEKAATMPQVWMTYGGTYDEQRFSRLSDINKSNVQDLGVAWTYDLQTSRGVEATPIVVDGVMYVTGAWSIVYAMDAKTGKALWTYDPKVSGEDAAKGCCDVVNRGVAIQKGKVFVGVFDGRLEALDARTGKVIWSTMTVDHSKPYTITGAPRVVKNLVLIGNGGAELGVRGYVSAYDVDTGKLVWRFYTTPNPDKQPDGAASDDIFTNVANDTWGDRGKWKTEGGGGTVWDSIIYDTENNSVIFGVGNASPWNATTRDPDGNGDNYFLSSIVAVDADTGAYKWHFQTTPREQWDYTATQSLILADLPLGKDGAPRRVVMQAPKNGFFYVLDAKTGEFISGKNFVPVNWASGLDEHGRPIENPAARYADEQFLGIPGPAGAHNWHAMAYSPQTKLAYIPAQQVPQIYEQPQSEDTGDDHWNVDVNMSAGIPPVYPAGTLDAIRAGNMGRLIAWDPIKQEERWHVEHSGPGNGGILTTTTGLVFQGTINGKFTAYDAASGDKLWSRQVNAGMAAAPATYEIDGEQYIAITTGWGGTWALSFGHVWENAVAPQVGRVVVFKLGGTGTIPDPMAPLVEKTPKAPLFPDVSDEVVMTGLKAYSENCMVCHGPMAISSGVLPDLRWSYQTADSAAWNDIVMNGALTDNGMISFKKFINADQAEAIRAYVLSQAWMAVENGNATAPDQEE